VDKSLQPVAENLAKRCVSVEMFFAEHVQANAEKLLWDNEPREILLHGHCHQKALWGTAETKQLLEAIPNAIVTEIDSGCCGVAGSFGYEHYDVSMTIANDRLLPAIEANPNAIVTAPGTSCRAQIHDSGHGVMHPVEVVAAALV
jgi:Fe-S oxidoreductase